MGQEAIESRNATLKAERLRKRQAAITTAFDTIAHTKNERELHTLGRFRAAFQKKQAETKDQAYSLSDAMGFVLTTKPRPTNQPLIHGGFVSVVDRSRMPEEPIDEPFTDVLTNAMKIATDNHAVVQTFINFFVNIEGSFPIVPARIRGHLLRGIVQYADQTFPPQRNNPS